MRLENVPKIGSSRELRIASMPSLVLRREALGRAGSRTGGGAVSFCAGDARLPGSRPNFGNRP